MALGLDGLRRKLLAYSYINDGQIKNDKPEKHLTEIVFHIEFYSQGHTEISFYNDIDNRIDEIAGMESKAQKWETILNKLLTERFEKDITTGQHCI